MNAKDALKLTGNVSTAIDISSVLFVTCRQEVFVADSDEEFASEVRIKVTGAEWILPKLHGTLWPYGGSEVQFAEDAEIRCEVVRRQTVEIQGIKRVMIRHEDGDLILEPPAVT